MTSSARISESQPASRTETEAESWLVGGGEMGALIRSLDWSTTPLGPLESWPHSLRTTVNLCLSSNFPINIVWGPSYNQIYNDGYRVIVGEKHPEGMGMAYNECWASAWPAIGQPFERAWAGETSFIENRRMYLTRSGYLEETFFTFSLSPIRDERGVIAGLFHPVTETTCQMLSERRTRTLRELAANTSEARSLETAFALIVKTLAAHELDLPFVLLYSLNEKGTEARLVDSTGIEPGLPASPRVICLSPDSSGRWPLAEILASESILEIHELGKRFGPFPCGPYPEGAHIALARILSIPGVSAPLGVFIAGISPRLPFHQEYRDHLEQVTTAMATALGHALAYEQERKRAEALAELDRAKTQFFSNISHEFRTPLTLMLGSLEDALAQAGPLPALLGEPLDVAHRNSLRLLRLVNSLLDFSRIEAGRAKASYEPTDLSALTAELASSFRSAIERAGLRLSVRCPPLPEPIYVDREMWEKIVLNLLSNAFKFTFEGGITVRLQPAGQQVELTVSDTGTGIPEHELPHLFERFHRVRSARGRTHEGTGIGLALVQELVRLHGGTVAVESTLGQGTTFRVRLLFGITHLGPEQVGGSRELTSTAVRAEAFVGEALRWHTGEPSPRPCEPLRADSALAPLTAGAFTRPKTGPQTERILVVDDNADMRDYLRRLLAGSYHVLAAANGEEGLRMALAEGPDLVLADIMMPVLDGFGLLQALRSHPGTRTIPVIFLSARAGEESGIEGLDAGADDYLVKPFSARELLARVGAHLKLARARKDADERAARILESITDGFYAVDSEWRLIYWNQVAERLTGLSRSDALGANLFETFPEGRPISVEQPLRRAVSEGVPVEFEQFDQPLQRWFSSRAYPRQEGGLSVYFRDVTEQKQIQLAVCENEARQAFLVRLGDALRSLSNPMEMQTAAFRLLGEHLGAARSDHYEDDENAGHGVHRGSVRAGKTSIAGVYRFEDFPSAHEIARGQTLVISDTANSALLTAKQRAAFPALGIAADIGALLVKDGVLRGAFAITESSLRPWTSGEMALVEEVAERTGAAVERARTEQALRESEERFRLFVENVQEYALFQTDPEGKVTSWNPGAERLFGYTSAEMLGQPAARLLTPDEQEAQVLEGEIARVMEGQQQQDARWLVRKDGSRFWAQWVTEPVRDETGRLRGVAKLLRDETERRRAEEALKQSLAEKEELLKEIHHRVKNNLQIITSLLNLQARQIEDEKTLAQFEVACNRVQSIASIHELLYRSGSFAAVALGPYADKLVHDVVRLYGAQERIRVEMLGEGASLELQRAVPFGLLLNELVSNACKHAFPHGQRGQLTINLGREDQEIVLTVSDTGIGLPRGFDYRTASSLGIYLVHSLARQLRAQVIFRSDQGTTAHVRWPVTVTREMEDEA